MRTLSKPVVLETDRLRRCLPSPVLVRLSPRVSVVEVDLGLPLASWIGFALGILASLLCLLVRLERSHVLL